MATLWDGYEDAGEDQLLGFLEGKVDAALNPQDPSVDERVARDLAQAIASHEWLKQKNGDTSYKPRLHARADDIRVGSWRPR